VTGWGGVYAVDSFRPDIPNSRIFAAHRPDFIALSQGHDTSRPYGGIIWHRPAKSGESSAYSKTDGMNPEAMFGVTKLFFATCHSQAPPLLNGERVGRRVGAWHSQFCPRLWLRFQTALIVKALDPA
jgi:hypothetical protein